jgi:hypothetical protein
MNPESIIKERYMENITSMSSNLNDDLQEVFGVEADAIIDFSNQRLANHMRAAIKTKTIKTKDQYDFIVESSLDMEDKRYYDVTVFVQEDQSGAYNVVVDFSFDS